MIFRNSLEVENHHFIMAEVRNFETFLQNEGLEPIGEIQTGILLDHVGSLMECC